MSDVSIDAAELAMLADQIADEHEPAPVETTVPADQAGPSLEQQLAGYQVLALAVTDRAADVLAPAWHITPDEKRSFSDAIANALVLWFPDQLIPPKYMALLVVAGVGLDIVSKRRDPNTGDLKPRHHAPPTRPTSSSSAAEPPTVAAAA